MEKRVKRGKWNKIRSGVYEQRGTKAKITVRNASQYGHKVNTYDQAGKHSNAFTAGGPGYIPQPGFKQAIRAVRAVEQGYNEVEAARRGVRRWPAGSPKGGQFKGK